jgi:hypothetical protein
MKNHIWTVPGGGIFSRIFHCAIMPLADVDFDNVYLRLSPFDLTSPDSKDILGQMAVDYVIRNLDMMKLYGIQDPYDHVMTYIIDQQLDDTYQYQGFLKAGPVYDKQRRIEDSPRLGDYRRAASKIKFRQDVIQGAENNCRSSGINQSTLGVHVRLTTMSLHSNYEQVTIEDYIRTIEQTYSKGKYNKIFVSSDNHQSLSRLADYFGDLITSYSGFERLPCEIIQNESEWAKEADWFFHERNWHQAFYDMITLAHCGGLVCRESNFTNMAIVWSRSLQHISRVYLKS